MADVENAVANRTIVRTWPMRGTLHFIPAPDIRWMLELLNPRILAGMERRATQLGLDARTFAKAEKIFTRFLAGGRAATREEMLAALEQNGVEAGSQRGYHILCRLSIERLLCFGLRDGKQPTFVLLDDWLPAGVRLEREAALATLARRFFKGHGPATLQDFVWWTGLRVADAKAALASVAGELEQRTVEGTVFWMKPGLQLVRPGAHLLAAFDEYLLGYKDRSAVLDTAHAQKVVPGGNGVFLPLLVSDGRIVGTWKRAVAKERLTVTMEPLVKLSKPAQRELCDAVSGYGAFMGAKKIIIKNG